MTQRILSHSCLGLCRLLRQRHHLYHNLRDCTISSIAIMSPGTSIFVLSALLSFSLANGQNEEIRLIKKLMEKYPMEGGRPVANASDVLDVKLKMNLLNIGSLDQENKVFTVTAWLYQQWTDTLLKWDPANFNGIDYVLLDLMAIWRPDVTLFNSLEKPELLQSVKAHVGYDGTVIIVEPYKYTTQCPDVTPEENKPKCTLKFGSWAYDTTRMTVTSLEPKVDIGYFQASNIYELLGSKIVEEAKTYPCCPGTSYGSVSFTIELEKRKKEPKVDPNDSAATTSVPMASTVVALLALQMALAKFI